MPPPMFVGPDGHMLGGVDALDSVARSLLVTLGAVVVQPVVFYPLLALLLVSNCVLWVTFWPVCASLTRLRSLLLFLAGAFAWSALSIALLCVMLLSAAARS